MCKVDVYPLLNPDGTQGSRRVKTKCEVARRGDVCRDRQVFRHALSGNHLPPSPCSTSRSSTPIYRSGDESGGSNGSRNKRRSGVYIEVNGRPVYNDTERRRRRESERVIVVESPPTPRTPPQAPGFRFPNTAPPSPSPLDPARRVHPIIVDERTTRRPVVHMTTAPEYVAGHGRTPSSSSHRSRASSASDDERFRWETYATRPRRPTQAELDRERLASRIAAANAEINRRQAVPMPPTPPQRSASTYIRPAVEVRMRRPGLVDPNSITHPDPLTEMRLREDAALKIRRAREAEEERLRREEEEAQKARLRERMTPQRRASVGNGSRRPRVTYPEGVYRWE